jgi:Carboxypeptidase regulatory-like domain
MKRILFSALCLFLFVGVGLVSAQTYEGRILGTVTDQSGAAVRGARIAITNVETSATREVMSNDTGDYVAPSLTPGVYRVIAEITGFKKAQRDGLRLEVGKDLRIDLTLVPGSATDTVMVSSEVPLIETTNDWIILQ